MAKVTHHAEYVRILRDAGCTCDQPLLGERPGEASLVADFLRASDLSRIADFFASLHRFDGSDA